MMSMADQMISPVSNIQEPGNVPRLRSYRKAKRGLEKNGTRRLARERLEKILPTSAFSTDWLSRDLARAYLG